MANESKRGNGQGNGHDKQLERLQQRRQLAQLSSKGKLDALLSAEDAAGLIRSVPAEDLYFTIVDVGLADALEVVQLASPAQFRTFVDLAGWRRDELQPEAVLTWLRAARGEDSDEFLGKLVGLDLEVLELVLRKHVIIHSLEDNPDVHPERPTLETPEGKYLLEITAEGADFPTVREILTDLIAKNPFETVRLLEAIRWEVPTELEEQAYQFRRARLGDLGFPPLEEAAALYTYLKVPELAQASTQALQAPGRIDYLDAALRGLTPEERDILQDELRYLVNSALVAEGAEPGDVHAIRDVSERARDSLALGLEHLSAGDPTRAVDVVRDNTSKRIFQVGFSLTLKLKHRADRIARLPAARVGEAWMVLASDLPSFEALRRKRPLRALKVEGADPVPFRSRKELLEADALLDRVAAQVAIAGALLGGSAEAAQERLRGWPGEVSFERVLSAAIAHGLLAGVPEVKPLSAEEAKALLDRIVEARDGNPGVKEEALLAAKEAMRRKVDAALHPHADALVQKVLESVAAELGPAHLGGTLPKQVLETVLPISGGAGL